jgi:hypothetical protein
MEGEREGWRGESKGERVGDGGREGWKKGPPYAKL